MRLIDADELIAFLENVTITDGITFETGFKQIIADIKNEPTAFDVEKVVEQLQGISDEAQDEISVCEKEACQYYDGFSDGVDKAIEIVKRGGRDD